MPSVSTGDRNAGPVPGRGPRSVTASSTATSVGSASISAMVAQVRRRRTSLASSTRIMTAAPTRSALSEVAASTTSSRVRRSAPSLGDPDPRATSRALSAAGSASRTRSRCPSYSSTTPSSRLRTCVDVGRVHDDPAGGAASTASSSWSTSRPRSSTPTRVHSCSTSASRWLERKTVVPARLSSSSSSRISWMPCGSRPLVGSSSTSSRGRAAGRRPGRAAAACRASTRGPGARPRRPARPARAPRRPGRGGCARSPSGAIASNSARLRRPDRWGYAAGPSTSAPTCGSTRRAARGIGSPSSSTRPDVASTRPSSIRTVVVLPEPLAPRKP